MCRDGETRNNILYLLSDANMNNGHRHSFPIYSRRRFLARPAARRRTSAFTSLSSTRLDMLPTKLLHAGSEKHTTRPHISHATQQENANHRSGTTHLDT